MEKFILSLDQIVRWVMGSFEFLTRDYFFCSLTELTWCELPGSVVSGTALWSWWSSLFQKGEVVRRYCTWSWTCLAALDAFDIICVQKWTKLSHGAPVQLLSLILGLSSAWWRIGSRSLGTSGFVVSPCNLQVFRQHSTLYLCTSGVPTTRRQYGAELFTLGALFLAHMAMAGSASLNVDDDPTSHSSVEMTWLVRQEWWIVTTFRSVRASSGKESSNSMKLELSETS